jgi:hypothetical protein
LGQKQFLEAKEYKRVPEINSEISEFYRKKAGNGSKTLISLK